METTAVDGTSARDGFRVDHASSGRPGGRRWAAPRLAYELAAAYAEAASGGGCDGPGLPPAAAKIWDDLEERQRRELAVALRAQACVAVRRLADYRPGLDPAAELAGPWLHCENPAAVQNAAEMVDLLVPPWRPPACPGCAAACAARLCALELSAYRLIGFTAERVAGQLARVAAA